MDMQDVSNLTIPEGQVRAIHDKDNRLLWGRVAYDVKYAGNIFQQAYTGKNLFNVDGDFSYGSTNHQTTSNGDGTITTKSRFSSSRSSGQKIDNLLPNTAYTITATIDSYTGSGEPNAGIVQMLDSSSGSVSVIKTINFAAASGIPNTISETFTTPANVSAIWVSFNGDTTPGSGVAASATFSQIQIEPGSQSSSYEPYTGGQPAPSPDYPQLIQVVTGTQNISITDGANTQNFTANLGSIKLCKIGSYQDYIYKSGDDWYVHKATKKVEFNGTEAWDKPQSDNVFRLPGSYSDMVGAAVAGAAISDFFVFWPNSGGILNNLPNGQFGFVGTLANINFRYDTTTTISAWETWLTTHNVSVYYVLATPTESQITDTTLISQLDAIHEWMTRYGYNSVVIGNLPIIIDRTNL